MRARDPHDDPPQKLSIDGAGEEAPETQSECRRGNILLRPASRRNQDATADTLWQQGVAMKLGARYGSAGMVCPDWSRSFCIQRAGVAMTGSRLRPAHGLHFP
jgi:hypothetical protein